jgi:hypothetical protein
LQEGATRVFLKNVHYLDSTRTRTITPAGTT